MRRFGRQRRSNIDTAVNTTVYEKLSENRERILSLWQAAVLPQRQGLSLAASSRTRFTAPVDYLLKTAATALFDWLISEEGSAKARASLQEICKLKAVQVFNPSEALSFILDLKGIIRLVLGDDNLTNSPALTNSSALTGFPNNELNELDKRIDQLMLLAFDEYSDYREQIMEIRSDEIRRLAGRKTR